MTSWWCSSTSVSPMNRSGPCCAGWGWTGCAPRSRPRPPGCLVTTAIYRAWTRRCRICGGSRRQRWPRCASTVAPRSGHCWTGSRLLSGLYATGGRKVPDGVPTDFVPHRRRGYLEAAAAAGDVTAYRRYWELCVLLDLRDGLRCGDVFVPGSRRYADPASFLLTSARWEPQRSEFCRLVGKPPAAADALA